MAQAFTVLFVEDEAAIRDSMAVLLRATGFRVLTAPDGYEALRILKQHHVDIVFTDIMMPGLNGIELAKQVKALHRHLPVLFATGYASKAQEAMALGKLLYKPVRAHEIETAIRSLLP